ncbi:hypothetical protein [Megamonas hypermegale]|uniref:hypothetical protein n=1 Tax=Megamonas hypermegale TaxID=158847 RepID=UPI0026F2F46F|nr:hypothetical protein [Megamonas hypermegale]
MKTVIDAEFKDIPKTTLNGFGTKEIEGFVPIAADLLSSYLNKSAETTTLDWLKNNMTKYLPDTAAKIIDEISDELIGCVDEFNNNMRSLEENSRQGKTNEQWMQSQLRELPNKDINETGEYLSQVERALASGNQAVENAMKTGQPLTIDAEPVQKNEPVAADTNWNKYALNGVISNIAAQASIAGLNGAMLTAGADMVLKATEKLSVTKKDIVEADLSGSLDTGLKVASTAALKIAADMGKIPLLKKTPISTIASVACWGVESVKAITNFASGKKNAMQTVDHLGKAAISAITGLVKKGVDIAVWSKIPVIGPYVGMTTGTAVGDTASKKVGELLKVGFKKIRPIAATALETTKKAITATVDTVKNVSKKVCAFFGF